MKNLKETNFSKDRKQGENVRNSQEVFWKLKSAVVICRLGPIMTVSSVRRPSVRPATTLNKEELVEEVGSYFTTMNILWYLISRGF